MSLPRCLLLFFTSLLFTCVRAQSDLRWQLDWQETQTIEWEGQRRVIFKYYLGGDAGKEKSGALPSFVATLPARSGIPMRVEVVSLQTEPFTPPRGFDAEPETEFAFNYSATRQPEGFLGKVSGPSIIRTAAGLERLLSLQIRLVEDVDRTNRGRAGFATNSVLREGELYRFAVPETGMYKLTRAFLIDELKVSGLEGIDPRDLKIFGQPGGMLPETTNEMPPDDLIEQAIAIEGEGDGSFDGGDYILLFAEGADGRSYDELTDRYEFRKNIYSTRNYYYLQLGTSGRGKRVSTLPTASGGTVVDSYDALYHFEEERENVLHELGGNSHGSGQTWFGEFFKVSRERNYPDFANISDLVSSEPVRVRANMGLRTDVNSQYVVEVNGQSITSFTGSRINFGRQEQSSAVSPTELIGSVNLSSGRVGVRVVYPVPAGAGQSEAWLDYVQLHARRQLSFGSQDQFTFRDARSREQATVTFQLLNPPADARVWRVDGADVRQATLAGGSFGASAGGTLYEYVAFRPTALLLTPEAVGKVENQNLHAVAQADMIVVTHPDFLVQAEELAEHRRTHNGYTVRVATTQQIYNEFSSGRDDAAAIRNFVRMVYERDPDLKYLLLFGDGSFDHRNLYGLGNNFIPVFEHDGAFTEVKSFPADDFFGIIEPAVAGQPLGPNLSVAVGRLPVKSADEAVPVVEKLIRYDTDPSTLGDWRTRMVFVGDDEDGGRHTEDVNRVANAVESRKPDLNFDKLYFDLFPQQSLSAGDRFPAITEGLDRAIFRGALAVTYLGHGGPRGLGAGTRTDHPTD